MRVGQTMTAASFLILTATALAQGAAPSRVPDGKPDGATAPQARKATVHTGKQGEGQTEDDLYVGARKQPAPATPAVRSLGGGFTATFRQRDAEITVPPTCDANCRRAVVDRLRRGGYQARLSDQGGSVLVQGTGTPRPPGLPGAGWCEEDCRKHLQDLIGPLVRGGG